MAGDLLPATDISPQRLQVANANDLTEGFSGGPVFDEVTGQVIGMVSEFTDADSHMRGLNIVYATPTDVLRQAWPDLKVQDLCPYLGLEPFTLKHSRWFHGREAAVQRVLVGLDDLGGTRHGLLVLGPSGAGQVFLIQAGVLPALAAGQLPGSDRWLAVVPRPGQDMLAELDRAGLSRCQHRRDRRSDKPPAGRQPCWAQAGRRVILVIDQWEEVLTQPVSTGTGPGQPTAVEQVSAVIGSGLPVSVVLVMRDDFYPQLAALAPELVQELERGLVNVPATLS